jgi:ATP-dependent DNA ligase
MVTHRSAAMIPVGLRGPVQVELARAVDAIPGANVLAGGTVWEPKLDGYRGVIVRESEDATRIWSRNHRDLTDRFPDVARAATAQLPPGVVVDGELVILVDGRLSFDALQHRLVTTPARARRLVAMVPASFVAFDLLAVGGVDLRSQRWTTRRRRLESLAAWTPPLQLSLVTDDVGEAEEWFEALSAIGVEGLVAKGKASRYEPGRRGWLKVKHRDTVEVIVGGVLGSLEHPEVVIAGRYRVGTATSDSDTADTVDTVGGAAKLVQVGRTVPLTAAQSAALAAVLRPAGPDHPWPDEIGVGRWAKSGATVALTKVDPSVVIEVSADAALQAGQWRHGLRFVRPRPDLLPSDVPPVAATETL